jgi:hypothetical protein
MLIILTAAACLLVLFIVYSIRYSNNALISFAIATILCLGIVATGYYFSRDFFPGENATLLKYFLFAAGGGVVYGVVYGQRGGSAKKQEGDFFDMQTESGKRVIFRNPFDNFLFYGGAGAGKTKTGGKPLLQHYIRLGWAGFLYDYKDTDYTRTAFELVKRYKYPHSVYHINFINLSASHRVNIIKPSVIKDPNFFIQVLGDILTANMAESKQDEWFLGALGIWRGVGVRFFMDYPHICTIPHIVNYIAQTNDNKKLQDFLSARPESRGLASAYLAAAGSERTQASFRATLGNLISELSYNKNVQYILSGDDFDYNLIDPADPKLLIVANSYKLDSILGPIASLMITVAARSFTMENKVNFFNFLDEPTTFKIPGFEKMLSVLREYRVSFAILTQSPAKLEKLYGKLDLRSIEANCGNKFFGRSLDPEGAESSAKQFSRREEQRVTQTTGHSTHSSNRSRSVSKTKEQRYDPDYFMKLKPGEFVGRAQNSNYVEFQFQFKQYVPGAEEEPNIVRPVLDRDVQENYNRIISQVSNLE